jgi:hypothetical protein
MVGTKILNNLSQFGYKPGQGFSKDGPGNETQRSMY